MAQQCIPDAARIRLRPRARDDGPMLRDRAVAGDRSCAVRHDPPSRRIAIAMRNARSEHAHADALPYRPAGLDVG
jgi:hypothetical protein